MKKNLVLLIPQLRHGGAERVASHLSNILKSKYNIKIVVFDDSEVTYEYSGELISLNLPVISGNNIFLKIFNLIKRIYKFVKFKKSNDINITYSFGDSANIINVLSWGRDQKIISYRGFRGVIQGKSFYERFILKPVSRGITYLSDKVIAVSNLINLTLVEEYKVDPKKIFTVYNGYDINKINKMSKETLNLEEKEIFKKPVIITAGTFRYEKGYWHLLKSFKIVLENNSNVQLVILGNDYKDYKEKVIKLAENLKISKNVHFFGYTENPYKYFANSDVYALSSVFEGFPNALVEAMACGLPIVANDCQSGPREILAPNIPMTKLISNIELVQFGLLTPRFKKEENFEPNDIFENHYLFGKGLLLLLNDSKLREIYKHKGLDRISKFTFERWKEEHIRIIEL